MTINCDTCASLFDSASYSSLSSPCTNLDVAALELKCETKREFVDSVTYESNKPTSVHKDALRATASRSKSTNSEGLLFDATDERDEMSFIFFTAMRNGFSSRLPKAPCVHNARNKFAHSSARGDREVCAHLMTT